MDITEDDLTEIRRDLADMQADQEAEWEAQTDITITTHHKTGEISAIVGAFLYVAPRTTRMADLPTLPEALTRIVEVWSGETDGDECIAEWTELVMNHPLGGLALQIAAADTLG